MNKRTINVGDTVAVLDLVKHGKEFARGTVVAINRASMYPYDVEAAGGDTLNGIFAPGELVKVRELVGSVKDVYDVLNEAEQPLTINTIANRVDIKRTSGKSVLPAIMHNGSIGARLRDLRKPVFGQYKINVIGKGRNAKYQLAA